MIISFVLVIIHVNKLVLHHHYVYIEMVSCVICVHPRINLSSVRIVFLIQRADAKTENCTDKDPASDLPVGYACSFNWFHIVNNQEHPCSDNNMYGFKKEQPCVLVKVNKVRCRNDERGRELNSFIRFMVGYLHQVHYRSIFNN